MSMHQNITLFEIVRLFLRQPAHFLNNCRKSKRNKFAWIKLIIMVSWITMITILSYSFSTALLLSYFRFTPTKVADSIDDIISNHNLNIAGEFSALLLRQQVEEAQFKNLITRIEDYEKKMNISGLSMNPNTNFIDEFILQDMIEGKTVLLVNSFVRVIMQDTFVNFKLEASKSNYDMSYLAFRVSKNSKHSSKITIA